MRIKVVSLGWIAKLGAIWVTSRTLTRNKSSAHATDQKRGQPQIPRCSTTIPITLCFVVFVICLVCIMECSAWGTIYLPCIYETTHCWLKPNKRNLMHPVPCPRFLPDCSSSFCHWITRLRNYSNLNTSCFIASCPNCLLKGRRLLPAFKCKGQGRQRICNLEQ